MNSRERVKASLEFQTPDRIPFEFSFTPALQKIFEEKTGEKDPREYFGMDTRHISPLSSRKKQDFSPYLPSPLPPGTNVDEFGVAHVPGDYYHFTSLIHPLENLKKPEELENYPFPDLGEDYRYVGLKDKVKEYQEKGYFVVGAVGHIFEIAWEMRGMERFFMDLIENPEFVDTLLEKITRIQEKNAEKMALTGVDMIVLGDDIGMQDRMLMSPDTWREWLKPRLKRVIESARKANPEVYIFYHSDGDIRPVIADLIEVGVQILNPVQPECMDPEEIRKIYGKNLVLWGTIGTQSTMPFGTPEEIKKLIRERALKLGKEGGLFLAPTHVLEPEVPWENILAFVEGIQETRRILAS